MPIKLVTGAIVVAGTTDTVLLDPIATGKIVGAKVIHTGAGFTLTVTDAQGFDILDGLGIVGASGLQLSAGDIGGNPAYGQLTANVSAGTDTQTATLHLYIDIGPKVPQAFS